MTTEERDDVQSEGPTLSSLTAAQSSVKQTAAGAKPLSKNQAKKLKRQAEWEDGREARKVKRREKTKERKARRREEKDLQISTRAEDASGEAELTPSVRATQVPITLIYDCSFDDLMADSERISLASQLTRAYSDVRKSKYRMHMVISSFGGKLRERFEGVLSSHHKNWKGVRFFEQDFAAAAETSKKWMKPVNGELSAPLEAWFDGDESSREVVYLTSDSPETLTALKPFSTYIIGGIVDKNRHKGICYERAGAHGMKTAKLPIGQYMQMQSRQVLATNHVGEIMLRWLEHGDWGKAFLEVIPKRKGGSLKQDAVTAGQGDGDQVDGAGSSGESGTADRPVEEPS